MTFIRCHGLVWRVSLSETLWAGIPGCGETLGYATSKSGIDAAAKFAMEASLTKQSVFVWFV